MNFDVIDSRCTSYNARVQLWEYLKTRVGQALAQGGSRRDRITNAQELEKFREDFRTFFVESIGGLPAGGGAAPEVQVTGSISREGFTIQKILFETRPNVRVTANFYLPAGKPERLPAILFLCGHSADGKADQRYQSICQLLVAQGMAVLALDPTGQGERLNYFDPASGKTLVRPATGDHEYAGLQCLVQGHNLTRYMLHDAMRAVDFLSAHAAIDSSRIGITGSSGGGTQTLLMMLVDSRLAAAAPATFVTTRQAIFDSGYAQDAEQIWRGFTGVGYDHVDLLAAFAPRPLCVLAVTSDFFPIEGTRETVGLARKYWELCGLGKALQLAEDQSVHLYTQTLGLAAAEFFGKQFFGEGFVPANVATNPLSPSELWCTRSGQVKSEFADASTIHHENKAVFRDGRDPNRTAAIEFLREAVLSGREDVPENLRITRDEVVGEYRWRSGFWWSQKGLLNSGVLLEPAEGVLGNWPVTLAMWDGGTLSIAKHSVWIRQQLDSGRAVFVLNVSGMGSLTPHPFNHADDPDGYYGTQFRIADDLVSLGDSLAALRTYDVLKAVKVLSAWEGMAAECPLPVYAHGKSGVYAVLASALDSSVKVLKWDEPLATYRSLIESEFYDDTEVKSFIVPGLIKYADWTDFLEADDVCRVSTGGNTGLVSGCLAEKALDEIEIGERKVSLCER